MGTARSRATTGAMRLASRPGMRADAGQRGTSGRGDTLKVREMRDDARRKLTGDDRGDVSRVELAGLVLW